jgi:hypothetical protein
LVSWKILVLLLEFSIIIRDQILFVVVFESFKRAAVFIVIGISFHILTAAYLTPNLP